MYFHQLMVYFIRILFCKPSILAFQSKNYYFLKKIINLNIKEYELKIQYLSEIINKKVARNK